MAPDMGWVTILIVIALLGVSAFFAASETALTGVARGSMLRLAKQGSREAAIVSALVANRDRLIGALLLGNNIANIAASALATGILTAWFGEGIVTRMRSLAPYIGWASAVLLWLAGAYVVYYWLIAIRLL